MGHAIKNESELTEFYAIDPDEYILTAKTPKRRPNWFKTNIRKVVDVIAVFSAVFSATSFPDDPQEFTHNSGAIIYGNADALTAIAITIKRYFILRKNTGNVINIPENEFMDNFFVEKWKKLYKPNQTRLYPIGQRNKKLIDNQYNKLHE